MYQDINGKEIRVGSKVIWYDPEVEARDLTRVWEVWKAEGDIVNISDEYGEAEVLANELEVVGGDSIMFCPYCGSENIEWMGDAFDEDNETPYHCHKCDKFFGVI